MARKAVSENLPLIILLFLVVVAAVASPSFLSPTNLINLVHYNAELGLLCLGLLFVIVAGSGGVDLSVGATMALTGVIIARNAEHVGLLGSLAIAVGIGGAVGIANGLVISRGRVEPFMATFTVGSIVTALTLLYTGGGPVLDPIPDSVAAVTSAEIAGLPMTFFYFIATYLVGVVVMRHTTFGRRLYAMGDSVDTLRMSGVNTERLRVTVYVVSGVLAGLAGLVTTARLGMGEPRAGLGLELTAISAVVVGGVSLYGGKGTVTGAFVGILIFAVILNLMNILNVTPFYHPVAQGAIVIVAGLLLSRRKSMFLHHV